MDLQFHAAAQQLLKTTCYLDTCVDVLVLHACVFVCACAQWLLGSSSPLRRAAAQSLGLLAQVEGKRFGPRLWAAGPADSAAGPAALPLAAPVLACLLRAVAASGGGSGSVAAAATLVGGSGAEGEEGVCSGGAASGEGVAACAGWHEAYYCLLLLEKVSRMWGRGREESKVACGRGGCMGWHEAYCCLLLLEKVSRTWGRGKKVRLCAVGKKGVQTICACAHTNLQVWTFAHVRTHAHTYTC